MMYSVYIHTSPSRKKYVGVTKLKPERRWQNGRGYDKCPAFKNAIEKYGWDNIRHEIITSGLSKEEAEHQERRLIRKFQTQNPQFGYNCEAGGNIGKEIAGISRCKNSESHIGTKNPMYGKHHTDESKRKMSSIQKDIRSKNPRSPDYHKKVSESLSKSVINLDTGETFSSVKEASLISGACYSCISEALHGRNKTAGGYRWAYASSLSKR